MDTPLKPETVEVTVEAEPSFAVPTGFPEAAFNKFQKGLRPKPNRSLAFENDKQRNAAFIQKGLTKPGKISYDVLRRSANSVHIARICINVLKSKITKTPWVIKSTDALKEIDEKKKLEIENLLNHPNSNSENFRSLMDKILEDLLVLDAVSIEKTRYPNGKLAELFFVDSATIRPVFDEFGNQDVEIPLKTDEGTVDLPVSYLQVINNSQYGGPEAGDIVAAWPKKDFIHFHAHPQGSMEGYGYGLSPLEGVLSVVANLLNADNYNSTYFEEGSFPPIIIHFNGQVNQRDLDQYREYFVSELTGNFHRPAITMGQQEPKVLDLKSDSNRDMQFMEYTEFLAKLLCAAYGLSPQDIGLTDDVNRSTSETMEDLSNQKGYGSILNLIKEVINQQIIWEDFGYKDIEFDWVSQDSTEPAAAAVIYDTELKNGTSTVNEVRERQGKTPYGDWADEPMLLTATGYVPILATTDPGADEETEEDSALTAGEKPFQDQDTEEIDGTEMTKSRSKTMYIQRPVKNADEISRWAKEQGFTTTIEPKDMHVTIAFSRTSVNWDDIPLKDSELRIETSGRSIENLGDATVLTFQSEKLQQRWADIIGTGASWDYETYTPHISLTYVPNNISRQIVTPYLGPIILGPEERSIVNDDWVTTIKEKNMRKAVLTGNNFKTWADDRGYSQPFIFMDVLSGQGMVIKPPVAVNMQSQELEMELTHNLAERGLNVNPVNKMSYVQVRDMLRANPDVLFEFEKYCAMTEEYDSEKWRSKLGGSRKFAYYLVTEYIDGYALSNPLLLSDMKRDPNSYKKAVTDLSKIWKVEKELVLGDRRADQYIITHEKRGYGFDYQFMGDKSRWERTKNAIQETLEQVPELREVFAAEINKKPNVAKRIIKRVMR